MDTTDPAEETVHLATRRLLNDELRHRLDVQRSSGERVETKATVVLSLAITAIPWVVGADLHSGWLVPTLVAFIGTVGCSLMVLRIRQSWELDPESYVDELWTIDDGTAQTSLAERRLAAFTRNRTELHRRIRWWYRSIAGLIAGAAMAGLHLWVGES